MISDDDLYWYRATYVKNHDGDTVTVMLDLGYNIQFGSDIRMFGINTPELQGATMPAAKIAQLFLESLLKASVGSKQLRMKSYKDQNDKYGGRVLGELWLPVKFHNPADPKTAFYDPLGEWTNLNQLMIKAGHAKPYFGVGDKS